MTSRRYGKKTCAACLALFVLLTADLTAQPSLLSFELKKPKNYENRSLPSEKSADTKFGYAKRLYNNTVSRFNYYFNASNILNEVIAGAKLAHKDDYTQLLSFYNYEPTEAFKDRMDTILYKTTAGIVLHDLRSDWVDKLYLLMGKAYLFRKDFDSAGIVFEYINYAFAPKDGGYDLPVGSNASNTNGVFTIATRENRSLWKRMMSFPPSRNESFLWQVRNYLEQDKLIEAGSLLEMVRNDPNFPERLHTDLEELTAYLLYKQNSYSAAAGRLVQALGNAENKLETARWEYLAAQLYELGGDKTKASVYFDRSIRHTTDPLMEVYARLNMVSLASGSDETSLQKNLDELLRMARRDKYETQRDIIYYSAARLELKRSNYAAAQDLLLKSIQYNSDNPEQRQQSFLLLGDLNYTRKAYTSSHRYYDSVQVALLKDTDQQRVNARKPALQVIAGNQETIAREDSLQHLAGLTPDQRNDIIRKELRRLRKEKGLKDIATDPGNMPAGTGTTAPPDLFGNKAGEFYFQNASLRARGLGEFKSHWGNRPNVDNWRRQNAIDKSMVSASVTADINSAGAGAAETELTTEALAKNIPLTAAQIDRSHSAIIKALLDNAHTFQNKLEDHASAIGMYEELIRRYPESAEVEDALYNLSYLYAKTGDQAKADAAAAQLKRAFPNGKLTRQLNAVKQPRNNDPAQQAYESVYRLFIEGNFSRAKEAKTAADKQFGKNYWTPQLLYIESIYYIKQKNDSTAIDRLQNIAALFPNSPLAEKAGTMIDVLRRRKEIEAYLTNLDISRPDDVLRRGVDLNNTGLVTQAPRKQDSVSAPRNLQGQAKQLTDLSNTQTVTTAVPKKDSLPVFVAPGRLDAKPVAKAVEKPKTFSANGYTLNLADTQFVAVVLDNVDPIFITEARNAFNRFNQERYAGSNMGIYNSKINAQYSLLLMGPFGNAADAVGYIEKTKPLASSRIIPWLAADKFSFLIISNDNMNQLVKSQDLAGYRALLNQVLPDKF
ncbi:type IX secretion system periplasmic lipoprotein PorW/SprE [Sediminibacterium soli]|uniref:type IX secretion system periplasmic lipoprotein PorW/SprE n=1 Tax=Sediminibacterium soli TaxID=2698829 RepID=UPI00137B4568|nr:tetratricopeptide repeat protein [Sediminibacterium soli]NCI46883.1 tetratricopeptide repeat protein [Sediminibacterium soli]